MLVADDPALEAPLPQPRVDVLAKAVGDGGFDTVFFGQAVLSADVAAGLSARVHLVEGDARCLVVDLGSLSTRDEQRLVAAAVLSTLWNERERRQPVLIVMDEAHNVCPAEPDDPLTALSTELAVRIAAEGRKFGLYLLVSTQRPQKVAENALTQCDNLLLMRMNSRADLAFVGDVFSFVPPGLLARATDFVQGECLVAGKIAPHPAFLRIGARVTYEGGGDVPADWAASRSA